ncbi:MAG TPA: penicillin-binding transpeptidase domain-containing protein, partial [Acidobacteriota bacterium]|nr:penicillin-binding transpeptidase domain-containing protein [Acidobacteriota bacterium]
LRLAELLSGAVPNGLAAIFKASALIELNRFDEAAEAWGVVSASRRESWFGERLQSVLLRLGDSTKAFVYDRRGVPLGVVDSEGNFKPDPPIDLTLLQSTPVKKALKDDAGDGIRLSIDLDLTRTAQEALTGYRGSIVMLEPETGEILAAVSDSQTLKRESFPAFKQLREPASISKLITTTASLRAGLDVDSEIAKMNCSGAERYHGGVLYCAYRAGPLGGLDRAMAVSCNIAFANLGVRIGRSSLLSELRRFGFDREGADGFEFGRVEGAVRNGRELADLSIGLEATSITPLHAALIAATFANGGSMPEPRVTHASDGRLGLSPSVFEAEEGIEVIDPEMSAIGVGSMEAVTRFGGTGYNLAPAGFTFAMKTGTASDGRTGYHTNYIGFFPVADPKVVFCVRVTHQATSSRVRRATVKVMRKFLHSLDELLKSRTL